ncbi:MAG: aminotransferase class I/II-fold pyridoxal phosphate-dependent enzyme [Eubacteriales bacterium]
MVDKERIIYIQEMMLITHNTSLKEILKKIDSNAKGCVFVTDDNSRLVGVVTDGDVRRLLLNDYELQEPIMNHLNKEYAYAYEQDNFQHIIGKLNYKVRILPIVNKKREVVDYFEYHQNVSVPISQPHLGGNEFKYLQDAFLSTWISSSGSYITKFEEMFAQYCGVQYGVAVSNGTVALHLALLALEIGEGDEVIVPDITFAATINAVLYVGATPVIVDIEEDSWCIDPVEIEKAITSRTKAIIPVHIYGQPCDMEQIGKIAKSHNLYVIEDCAEAHGAQYDGQVVGSMSDISCFSFFGNKVITTGEGGMCLTQSKELEEKIRLLKDHGMDKQRKYYHTVVGYNYRMTNLQAAIGVAQLERIEEIHKRRCQIEHSYHQGLTGIEGVTLQSDTLDKREKIVWLVSLLIDEEYREECEKRLKENQIDVRPFFIPLSEMELYKKYTFSNEISSKISKVGINLPTAYDITEEMISRISLIIREVVNGVRQE